MRIAVVADIHGNLDALEAVIADMAGQAPDLVVNLGDTVSGPLDAAATADRLVALGWLTVRGNHDRHVASLPRDAMGRSDRAAFDQLTPAHRQWLGALPATATPIEDVFACHGRPDTDLEYLTEVVVGPHLELASTKQITDWLGSVDADVILCGHSHRPRLVRLPAGQMVLNPGSVGLQAYEDDEPWRHRMELGSPHARYALMDRTAAGWTFAHRMVAYDWRAAASKAERAGRLAWATALRTGRAAEDGE